MIVRIQDMLRQGVHLVWLIDPEDRDVTVFLPDKASWTVKADGEVTGGEAIPDLRCRVADFFALPRKPKANPPA